MSSSFAFVALLMAGAMAAAQAHAAVVTMSVTTPDGRRHELTAAESGLATLTPKDFTSTKVFSELVERWSGIMLRLALTHVEGRAIAEEALPLIPTQPRARQPAWKLWSGLKDRHAPTDAGVHSGEARSGGVVRSASIGSIQLRPARRDSFRDNRGDNTGS